MFIHIFWICFVYYYLYFFLNNLKLISQLMIKLKFILCDIELTDSLELIQRNIFLISWWVWSWYNSFHQYFQIASHINYEIISSHLIVIIIYCILNYYWLHIFESINFKSFQEFLVFLVHIDAIYFGFSIIFCFLFIIVILELMNSDIANVFEKGVKTICLLSS